MVLNMYDRMLTKSEKKIVLAYLNNGKVVAAAAGMAVDHLTKKHTDIPLLAYTDGKSEWTSEDILDKKFVARPRFENDDEIISAEITELYYVKRDLKMLNGITDGFEL